MEYDLFKERLMNRLLSETEEGDEIEIRRIRMNNGIFNEGISIRTGDSEAVPTVSLENCYKNWQKGVMTLDEIAGTILHETYKKEAPLCLKKIPEVIPEKQLRIKLINYEMNKEYLKEMPFRRIMDLAEICCYILEVPESGTGICNVTRQLLSRWGIDEEELFRTAETSTRLWDPPEYMKIGDVLAEYGVTGAASGMWHDTPAIYVAMGKSRLNGAVCLLYKDFLSGIADEADADLFLIPSSVHEILAVPDYGEYSKEELEKLVREVNRDHVLPEEVLSDCIYRFDRKKAEVIQE